MSDLPKHLARKLTIDDCLFWDSNRQMNPISKYTLSTNSKRLKEIQEICIPMLNAHNAHTKEASKSPTKKDIKHLKTVKDEVPVKTGKLAKPILQNKLEENEIFDHLYYPSLDDTNFRDKLANLYEFDLYKVPDVDKIRSTEDFNAKSLELCGGFEKTLYQYFISHYISTRTPYKSILLYHGVGVGKTCSAITLAEGFLTSHRMYDEPKIWVIMPHSLQHSFVEQIFSMANYENYEYLSQQCTGDIYIKLLQLVKDNNIDKVNQMLKKIIKSRYKLFTYDSFATFIENEYITNNRVVKDKIIIVDEAHNIRTMSNENSEKRVYVTLSSCLESGINNRLVLLSATPMYNKSEDILDLMNLLLINDKRTHLLKHPFPSFFHENKMDQKSIDMMKQLASNYISYLKGKNPFTFALKLSAKSFLSEKMEFLTHEFKKDQNNKLIKPSFKNWLSYIEDGILISHLGIKQRFFINNEISEENHTEDDMDDTDGAKSQTKKQGDNGFNNLQPMNIVYDKFIGTNGFKTFFRRSDNSASLVVNYNKQYINALYPDSEHLGKYSGKFLQICNIIKNSKGVVVIYSSFIWSGVIPLAICLEHMGFNREGGKNILNKPKIIPDAPNYNYKKSPKYCILSSHSEIMGSANIDSLIKIINGPSNIDGADVKIILMTPVASEGLSFFNVREMHIVEPWFHYNRVAQVIGRGIRNCRHQNLPLDERNTTVFMHASYDDDKKETADIHAFRIASQKLIQTNILDDIIRDNAIDCSLMKNINFFPKSLFELGNMKLKTSQGIEIDFQYGDNQEEEPKCTVNTTNKTKLDFRRETYNNFLIPVQNKLKNLLVKNIQQYNWYVPFEYIYENIKFKKTIINQAIEASVYPNSFIDGYILIPHNNGIHIVVIENKSTQKLLITNTVPEKVMTKKCNLKKITSTSIEETTVSLYLSLNYDCFKDIVHRFITSTELSEQDEFIANCLYNQGALIAHTELISIPGNRYIGYVNIFNTDFEPNVYIGNKYRDLTDRETKELLSVRRRISKPSDMTRETIVWGIITKSDSKKKSDMTNVFKILRPGVGAGIKTGMVCSSIEKEEQEVILATLGNKNKYENKKQYCHQIASQLVKLNRISINPEYKPTKVQ